mgnify:CR=1 FL=1
MDFEDELAYEEAPAEDDLSNVKEETPMPEAGWYRAKILSISTKPTKTGKAMRTALIRFNGTDGYETREYFAIGVEGRGGDIAKRRYRIFARCCGIEPDHKGDFKFTTSDIEGAELYVRGDIETNEGYEPRLRAADFRPLTEEPDEMAPVSGSNEDESSTPF